MSNNLKIKLHEDAESGRAFIGVTSVGKQALQKLERTDPVFAGKTIPAIANGVIREMLFALSYDCNLSDDVEECFQRMLEFGLDNVYSLRSKGWNPKLIASKIMKTLNLTPAASDKQESRSKKNEKSYLLDADDRKILDRHFYSDADMDLLERNFGMLKFVDSFFPDDKTNGTATKTEISAEDAETMVGDHESFLVLCMDTLANKDGFDYQVYRVYGPEGTDYITCSYT